MGERKVLNKYYPPDFDPSKITKRKQNPNQSMKTRNMLPMTIQCNSCRNFMSKGTKFYMTKETASETYLGISIGKFFFKCTKCCSQIVFRTDPRNFDYAVESGASRNFEPWRSDQRDWVTLKSDKGEMECLEEKAIESRREVNVLANLDELKSLKARQANVDVDSMLLTLKRKRKSIVDDKKYDNDEIDNQVRRMNDDEINFGSDYGVTNKFNVPEDLRVRPVFRKIRRKLMN